MSRFLWFTVYKLNAQRNIDQYHLFIAIFLASVISNNYNALPVISLCDHYVCYGTGLITCNKTDK